MNSPLMLDGTFDALLELADHARREAGKPGRQISTPENRGLGWHSTEESAGSGFLSSCTIMPGSNLDYKYKCEFLLTTKSHAPTLPRQGEVFH
jgi:hypothetical protein